MKTLLYRGVPVIGIAAYSGSGKTTLLRRLLPLLNRNGIKPAIIKHAHHEFDIDHPGKDSFELRKAGATQVLVGSGERVALVMETQTNRDPELADFLARLDLTEIDLVLVEGFRHVAFPKIEVHRKSQAKTLLYLNDEFIIAIVADEPIAENVEVPIIATDDLGSLIEFLIEYSATARRNVA